VADCCRLFSKPKVPSTPGISILDGIPGQSSSSPIFDSIFFRCSRPYCGLYRHSFNALTRHRPVLVGCCSPFTWLLVDSDSHGLISVQRLHCDSNQFLVNVVAQTLRSGGLQCNGHRYQFKLYVVVADLCCLWLPRSVRSLVVPVTIGLSVCSSIVLR
jgi:hypothetical protein